MTTQLDAQKIANRYAKALLEHAQELDKDKLGKTVQSLSGWFEVVSEVMEQEAALAKFLANPVVSAGEKTALLNETFVPDKTPLAKELISLLSENDRLGILNSIASEYKHLVDEASRIKDAYVTVPIDLNDELKDKFETRLKDVFDLSHVRLHVNVDPTILAGAVVKVGDQLIDGSAQGKLNMLSKQIG